ncbi:MAG: 16S rRNA (uracil(1498)-N(3))-methyltransferase [Bacteroidia bacterium]|nr:16S rRNA (uracil(1498)-N(3))-methyltransferase [Bacteroidia bacterium]
MQLFYHPDLSSPTIQLPEEESKHLVKVLRKQKGDKITLIDGKGNEAVGIIENDHSKKCLIQISSRIHHPLNRSYHLHIAIAPTKQTERMDWYIEKAIEIGIDEVTFIETQNSERNKINTERLEKIAIATIKQSKQYWLPKINGIKKLPVFIDEQKDVVALKLIAWCEEEQTQTLLNQLRNSDAQNVIILIGPEGDFTKHEVTMAKTFHFAAITLGTNILRTETAGIFVSAALASHY